MRISNGYFILKEIDSNINKTKEFEIANAILNKISKDKNIIFPLYERAYLAYHIIGKEYRRVSLNTFLSNEAEIITSETLTLLHTTFDVDIIYDFEFRISLCLHLEQLLNRLRHGTQMKNPLIRDIKSKYPYAYTMGKAVGSLIYKKTRVIVTDDEIGYISLSLQLLLERDKHKQRKKYILLVCPFGQTSANLIKYKYLETFKEQIENIETSSAKEVEYLDLKRFDYIFTMVPLHVKTDVPILNTNYFLNESLISEINNNLKDENVLKYFMNGRFVEILKADDKYDAIKKLCDFALKDNNLKIDLYENVLNREKMASTDYAYKTAVPHSDKLLVDETYICMAILDKPIKWKIQDVNIVVLVLIGRRDKDKVQKFYQLFAQFLMDEDKVNQIIKFRNKNKLIDLLKNIGEE